MNAESMRLWVVGQTGEDGPHDWAFVGVFDDEGKAVSACTSPFHFVGPCVLNEQVPGEHICWPGAYYPLGGQGE